MEKFSNGRSLPVDGLQEGADLALAAAPLAGDHGPRHVGHGHVDVEADLHGSALLCLGSEVAMEVLALVVCNDHDISRIKGESVARIRAFSFGVCNVHELTDRWLIITPIRLTSLEYPQGGVKIFTDNHH